MSEIYFIAETAFSHQGCEGYMSSLVDEIIDSDADVVKFQVLLESEYSLDHAMAHKCRELMFPKLYWRYLVRRVRASGKKVLILPVDYQALVWVVSEGLADILEIHSVNFCRRDFFEYLSRHNPDIHIILSVSGYQLYVIKYIVGEYKNILSVPFSLMFGFQAFPTDPKYLGLGRITQLKSMFATNVGYADHTSWDQDSSTTIGAAVGLGAQMIEKHIVRNEGEDRIDSESAIAVSSFNSLIEKIRNLDLSIGDSEKYELAQVERMYGERRLKLICDRPIEPGDLVDDTNSSYYWTTKNPIASPISEFQARGMESDFRYDTGDIIG